LGQPDLPVNTALLFSLAPFVFSENFCLKSTVFVHLSFTCIPTEMEVPLHLTSLWHKGIAEL
jgi:hypothetical protein